MINAMVHPYSSQYAYGYGDGDSGNGGGTSGPREVRQTRGATKAPYGVSRVCQASEAYSSLGNGRSACARAHVLLLCPDVDDLEALVINAACRMQL